MASSYCAVTLGKTLRTRDLGWFSITEAWHDPHVVLRPHAHRFPALTLVRGGGFGLCIGGSSWQCRDEGVFFKHGDTRHANDVGPGGARSLIIELKCDGPRALDGRVPLPDRNLLDDGSRTLHLARELEREFEADDAASEVAIEGLTLEILAQMLRRDVRNEGGARPSWLARVHEIIADDLTERHGLRSIAAAVGVGPSRLSRVFRSVHGCSMGEYVRRLRLDAAARRLVETDDLVSTIAQAAGFYDQAHFCRSFKRSFGRSPTSYRQEHRGE